MLTELKFVQGSVARKDFLPALTHFRIENGTVRGYNGKIALCSPIPFDIACTPKAEPLVRAINNCGETVSLSLTPTGRLSVRSGSFRAHVDCVQGDTPHVLPTGTRVDLGEGGGPALLAAVAAVQPFIGQDASRPWCNGVLLRGNSVFATNNITLAEYWVTYPILPMTVNLPRECVKELLRIGEPPSHVQCDDHSVTFHYEGGRWLRTQLLSDQWPDLSRVLDKPSTPTPIDPRLFEGLAVIKPFVDKLGRVLFKGDTMQTHEQEGEGAAYTIEGNAVNGIFNVDMLQLLEGTAHTVDFTQSPGLFFGENLRGAIIGMRS
jgi:DNA polymerase III sliding clamp (beta) subunit (PCNA family)